MIKSFNNTIACTPFKTTEVTTKKGQYFQVVESANSVEELEVLYGNDQIPAGSKVWVLSSMKTAGWAASVNTVTFEDKSLIFVPIADIKLVKLPDPLRPSSATTHKHPTLHYKTP